jgi:hypothetical protein
MRITVNHLKTLTDAEHDRLNDPINGGWDSEPKFSRFANIRMNPTVEEVVEALTEWDEYDIVADLEVPDLNAAYHASNNIDSNWLENEEVTSKSVESARSTSVGDILSDPDTGKFWLVMPMDFKDITNEVNAAYSGKVKTAASKAA